MPSVNKIIKFLEENQALRQNESPWPTFSPTNNQQERHLINWVQLFPSTDSNDSGQWPGENEVLEDLARDIGEVITGGDISNEDLEAMATSQLWDICAWYQPVHYYGVNWGIYIKEQCIIKQIFQIARFLPVATVPSVNLIASLIRASVYLYFLHEQYHHKVESLGIRLHVIDRKSSYLPYHSMVYNRNLGTDNLLEETLANADAYRRIWNDPYYRWIENSVLQATEDYLKKTFPYNPPGYRMATNYLTTYRFNKGEDILHGQVHEATLTPSQPTTEWEIATRLMQSMYKITDNIWTIVPAGTNSILPVIKKSL